MLNQYSRLPRDSRDTLFLLAVIACLIGPHWPHLPAWSIAFGGIVLIWRAWMALRSKKLPSRYWLLLLLVLGVVATAWTYRTLQGQDAGVTLLIVLLTLKTLELHARRDALVLFFLGFFVLLTQFLYSQSMQAAFFAMLGLFGLLTGLVNSHLPVGKPPLRQSAGIALRLLALGTPMMILLFLLFPRVAPLWGLPDNANTGRSGLSASMRVGSLAELALDDSVAMRVRFLDSQASPQALYFRGPVLSSFDGREWTALRPSFPAPLQVSSELEVRGQPLRYEATLEPSSRPWLMLLDASPDPPQSSTLTTGKPRMTQDLQWVWPTPITQVLRYSATAYPQFRHGPSQAVVGLQDYSSLPPGYNPRTYELAATLLDRARQQNSPPVARDLVNMALSQLKNGGYRYTLEPGVFGQHSADEFWFDRKQGFCEHITSAFVVLMRALGIPARVVTGYQGGEYNRLGGFWVVRQRDAHAWSEVWLAGEGWVRVDPTAALAPGRINASQSLAAPVGMVAAALGAFTPNFRLQLRWLWDAMNDQWNQWVVYYTQNSQFQLLRALGFKEPDWQVLGWLLTCAALAALALQGGMNWNRTRRDPWLRLLDLAQQKLQRAGLALPPQPSPREMANLLLRWKPSDTAARVDNQRQAIYRWLLRLEAQRYAPANDQNRHRLLMQLLQESRQLNWPQ